MASDAAVMPSRHDLELGDRHRDALPDAAGLAVVGGSGAVEHHRLRGLDVDDHLGQFAPHQRLVDQRPAERPPLPGVAQRLDQRATRVAQAEQRDAQPRRVGQLHHPAQALAVGRAGLRRSGRRTAGTLRRRRTRPRRRRPSGCRACPSVGGPAPRCASRPDGCAAPGSWRRRGWCRGRPRAWPARRMPPRRSSTRTT